MPKADQDHHVITLRIKRDDYSDLVTTVERLNTEAPAKGTWTVSHALRVAATIWINAVNEALDRELRKS